MTATAMTPLADPELGTSMSCFDQSCMQPSVVLILACLTVFIGAAMIARPFLRDTETLQP